MKLLCLMFAMLVLILSVKPCCADRECAPANAITKDRSMDKSTKEKECQGCCSPFFSCGSCVGFIVAKPIIHTLNVITENPVLTYTHHPQPDPKEIALAIWQPPQLV